MGERRDAVQTFFSHSGLHRDYAFTWRKLSVAHLCANTGEAELISPVHIPPLVHFVREESEFICGNGK